MANDVLQSCMVDEENRQQQQQQQGEEKVVAFDWKKSLKLYFCWLFSFIIWHVEICFVIIYKKFECNFFLSFCRCPFFPSITIMASPKKYKVKKLISYSSINYYFCFVHHSDRHCHHNQDHRHTLGQRIVVLIVSKFMFQNVKITKFYYQFQRFAMVATSIDYRHTCQRPSLHHHHLIR